MAEYPVTSFAAGELAPRFYGRFDMEQYGAGAKRLRNILVTPEGSATRRPGTRYFDEVYDSGAMVRFMIVEHSSDDATLIELGYDTDNSQGYLRFIRDGDVVEDGDGEELILDAPWDESEIYDIRYQQFGAYYCYLVHPNYSPRRLVYDPSADPQWVLEKSVAYDADPGEDEFQFKVHDWNYYTKEEVDFAGDNHPAATALYASRLVFGGGYSFPAGVFASASTLGSIDESLDFEPDVDDLSAEDAWFHTIYGAEYEDIVWLMSEQVLLAGTTNGLWRLGGPENPIQGTTESGAMLPLRQSSVGCSAVPPVMYGGLIAFVEKGGRRIHAVQFAEATQQYQTEDLTATAYHITESGIVALALQRRPWMILWALRADGKLASFTFSLQGEVRAWSLHEFSGEVEDVKVVPTASTDQVWVVVKREIDGETVRHLEYFAIAEDPGSADYNYVDSHTRWDGGSAYELDSISADSSSTTISSAGSISDDDIGADDARVRFSGTGSPDLDGKAFGVKNVDTDEDTFDITYLDGSTHYTFPEWSESTTYRQGNTVRYDGTLYVSDLNDNTDNQPDESDAWNTVDAGDFERVAIELSFSHLDGEEVHGLVDEATTQKMTADDSGCSFDRHGNRLIAGLPYTPEIETMNMAQSPSRKKSISEVYLYVLDSGAIQAGASPDKTLDTIRFQGEDFTFGEKSTVYTGARMAVFPGSWRYDGSMYITQPWPLPLTIVSIVAEVQAV